MKLSKTCRAVLAASALLFSGCVPEELKLHREPELETTIRIGALVPLTGPNRQYGMKMLEGIRFAVDELNNGRGANGKPIELHTFDTTSTAEGAARAVESAAAANVVGLIAGYDTNEVSAELPLFEKLHLPAVIPLATADEHVGANPFVFRNMYTDSQQAETIAAYLWYWRKVMYIGIMVDMSPSEEYSRNIAREVAHHFRKLGGEVTLVAEFRGNDYEKQLREIMTHAPRAIVLPVDAERAAAMIKLLRKLGYKGIVCGPDSWDEVQLEHGLAGLEKPGDCVYIGTFSNESQRREYKNFQKAYRERHFRSPGSCEILSYDAVKLLLIGLSDAADMYKFRKNWRSIRQHSGAAAVYTMLKNGGIDRTMYIKSIAPPTSPTPIPTAARCSSSSTRGSPPTANRSRRSRNPRTANRSSFENML